MAENSVFPSLSSEQNMPSWRLRLVNRKAPTPIRKLPQTLAKGQLWKMNDAYIQIVELGKRLIHYKMMKQLGGMGVRTRMSTIETMGTYLKTNRAQLVTKG
jgi:hypothetical protein